MNNENNNDDNNVNNNNYNKNKKRKMDELTSYSYEDVTRSYSNMLEMINEYEHIKKNLSIIKNANNIIEDGTNKLYTLILDVKKSHDIIIQKVLSLENENKVLKKHILSLENKNSNCNNNNSSNNNNSNDINSSNVNDGIKKYKYIKKKKIIKKENDLDGKFYYNIICIFVYI